MAATPLDVNAIDALELGMTTNVLSLIRIAQAFAPVLGQNGGGAFVQITSVASLVCASNFATHSACEAAAYSITLAFRELLARQGTAVLSVHPGLIASDMGNSAAGGVCRFPFGCCRRYRFRTQSGRLSSLSRFDG
jgi:NAD(P)-dependent dehydrogenase (short-subunit alcohol dehydrogenase family)